MSIAPLSLCDACVDKHIHIPHAVAVNHRLCEKNKGKRTKGAEQRGKDEQHGIVQHATAQSE